MRTLLFPMLVAALVACGGDDDSNASTSATTSSGAGGSGGSGAGGDASSSATGAVGQNVMFPLAVGREWTYQVTKVGIGGVCGEGTVTSKVSDSKELDGKTAYTVTPWCSGVSSDAVYAPGTGDEVFYRTSNEWQVALDGKLEDGHKWTFQGLEYSWKFLGMQTIAGTVFNDCWGSERTDQAFIYDVYCRGIGPIRHHYEVDGNGYDAVLVLP